MYSQPYSQPYCRVGPCLPSQPSLTNTVQYWSLRIFLGKDHSLVACACNNLYDVANHVNTSSLNINCLGVSRIVAKRRRNIHSNTMIQPRNTTCIKDGLPGFHDLNVPNDKNIIVIVLPPTGTYNKTQLAKSAATPTPSTSQTGATRGTNCPPSWAIILLAHRRVGESLIRASIVLGRVFTTMGLAKERLDLNRMSCCRG